jgi:transcriptional regulator with XRE-family HTH domain
MADTSIWGAYIAAYRKSNRLTQEQLAERLNVTPQTVSRWEAGKQAPDIVSQGALRQVIQPSFAATRQQWVYRVNHSNGYEILIDSNERIVALSDKVRAFWNRPLKDYLNVDVLEFLPGGRDGGAQEFARVGIGNMAAIGLFSGGVRHIFIWVDFWRGGVSLSRGYDIWPVTTADGDALGHYVGSEIPPPEGPPKPDGFVIRRCEVALMGD